MSGRFGPDDSVFESGQLASERFHGADEDAQSYRVEVDRYWRRTASRRAAAEARRADGFARADRAVARARRAEREEPSRPAERETPSRPAPDPSGSEPYRARLQAWARESAQEPAVGRGRRTVAIKGYGAEGYASRNGTRSSSAERHLNLPRHERSGFQPDRVAMWAVLLGLFMVLAAAASAHGAVLAAHLH